MSFAQCTEALVQMFKSYYVSHLLILHPCMTSSFYVTLASGNTEECTDSVALLATATGLQYLKHCGIQISSHYAAATAPGMAQW